VNPILIQAMFNYHYWARDRVLAAAELITPEQFTQSKGHSFDTLQGTFAHLMYSERLWLGRWLGQPDQPALNPADFPMLDAVIMYWKPLEMRMRDFVKTVDEAALTGVIRYTNLKGLTFEHPLWQMMQQVVLHGVHHRSEAATMLTELGHAPEPLDIIYYYREQSGQE
jgi:uncharacterized damage-inducible protein DinB